MTAQASATPAARLALWVALAATTLALALPIVPGAPGRVLTERVLLVAALILLGVAVARPADLMVIRRLVGGALVALVSSLALLVRFVSPVGVVLLAVAIGCLLWYRRAWAPG